MAFDFAVVREFALRECFSEILGCEVPDTSWGQLAFLDRRFGFAERSTIEHCSFLGKLGKLFPHSAVEAPSGR